MSSSSKQCWAAIAAAMEGERGVFYRAQRQLCECLKLSGLSEDRKWSKLHKNTKRWEVCDERAGPSLDLDLRAEGLYELVFGRVSPRLDC